MSSARIDPPKRVLGLKEGVVTPPPIHGSFHKVGLESSSTGSSFPADSAKPVPLAVVSLDSRQGHRIPLVRTSSELAVRRPGKAPERAVPSPSPGRHEAVRSRHVSSSSSPPTVDGFGTGTPEPSPQSQSFSRSYGSILPTSLAYIIPSTRGCSPWRPDAVMSTTGREGHSVLRIFKGRRECTGHHATCGALPAAGPYLRLSRFQGGQAICTDGRSARAHALGFAATAAPSYSSRPGSCPDGRYRCGPPPEFPLASPRSGIVHHLSGPDRHAHTRTLLRRSRSVGCAPVRDPANQLPCALRVYSPVDSHTCQTPWSVFNPRRSTPRIDRQTGLLRSASDQDASPAPIRFPPDNFKHSLTLFSKSFSSLPRGTCSLSVSRPYLALDGIYRPIGAAFPNNPTRRQRLVVRQGPGTTGLSPSLAPLSRELGPGNPCDAVIKSVPEPEANELHQTANPKTHQDMCSIKTAYLTNQEDIVHETKFPALYAQQGVNPNWNHHQRYSDKEDMNFTNRRFSIPSICEYPSLEVVSSPTKKRSDPNQSLDFKKDLLAFQQAKNGKKSPRKYGVMINFSKPDKPVLHLPYLEADRFNQLQTRHWRPGETSNHSGDQSKRPGESETFLQCTNIHQIIQNQTRPYLPFLESKAINSQQLFYHQDWHDFYTYFFSKEVPKKLTYSLKPSRYKTRIKSPEESHWNQEILLTASLSVSLKDRRDAMEYYSEEEDSFDSSQCSDIDETDQAWSSKEDGCERSCSADEYSSSEYGDDPGEESPEPKPPDHSQGNTRFYKKGGCRENKSWSIDTDSEISMGEEDECDPHPTQACNPLKKSLTPASYGVTPYKVPGRSKSTTARKAQSTPAATKKQSRTERGNTPDYLVFSGSSMDPGLRASNKVLTMPMYQENRWSSMSTPKARPAADKSHAHCPDPRKSLSTSKKAEEVEKLSPAKKYQGWTSTTSKHHHQATSRKEVSSLKPESASMPMSAHGLKPKKVTSSVPTLHKGAMRSSQTEKFQERPIPTLLMESQGIQEVCQRTKETSNQQENIRSQGPKEHESIEEEPPGEIIEMDQNKAQDIRKHMFLKEINSEASILPNPTSTTPGMIQHQDIISKANLCVHGTGSPSLEHRIQKSNGDNISNKWRQNPSQSYTRKSEPQESEATTECTRVSEATPREVQVHEIIPEPLHNWKIKPEPLIFLEPKLKDFETGLGTQKKCTAQRQRTPVLILGIRQGDGRPSHGKRMEENQGQHLTCPQNVEGDARSIKSKQAAKEQNILQLAKTIWVNLNFTCLIYKFSNPDIIHLFPAKSVEFISGAEAKHHIDDQRKEITKCLHAKRNKEVVISNLLILDVPEDKTPPSRVPDQNRGVALSFLLKEEPPDVPSKIKPIKYQGKVLESQKRMKPNLLYLGADYPVSRSKLFQGRGYDAVIKSVPEPEANELHQTANPKTHQDMCSIKTAYLTNQEDIVHETKFPALYAQQGVNPNWNHHQRYSDKEDMNFTNRRFSIPSICEYPSLEVVSSPTKSVPTQTKAWTSRRIS
ncbi:hypothetical protein YC2023_108441 [Brassica napus]